MPIEFNCPCGKALRVADAHAGRRVKCPACQTIGRVPEPEPMFEIVEEPEEQRAPAPAKGRPVAKPAQSRDDEDDEDDARGYSVAKKKHDEDEDEEEAPKKQPNFRKGSGRTEDDDDDEQPKKKKKRKKKRTPPQDTNRSLERNIINGGVAGGVLAMVGAVVWFVAGLLNDYIFFYPPILFIIGLIAFFKGLMGEE